MRSLLKPLSGLKNYPFLGCAFVVVLSAGLLTGCYTFDTQKDSQTLSGKDLERRFTEILGDTAPVAPGQKASTFNEQLWQESLKCVRKARLLINDPQKGRILTDWHSDPKDPHERSKLNIQLGEGKKVEITAFKQVRKNNEWVDVVIPPEDRREMEDALCSTAAANGVFEQLEAEGFTSKDHGK